MKMDIVHPTLLAQLFEDRDTARAALARLRRKVEGAMATLRAATTDAASAMRQLEEIVDALNGAEPAPAPAPACTGHAASWCPRCGDCQGCTRDADGEWGELSNSCPLHGSSSTHGEGL